MTERKVLELSLDGLYDDGFPSSKSDIGGRGHYINIEIKDREAFLDEMAANYRENIDESLYEVDWDD